MLTEGTATLGAHTKDTTRASKRSWLVHVTVCAPDRDVAVHMNVATPTMRDIIMEAPSLRASEHTSQTLAHATHKAKKKSHAHTRRGNAKI